MTTRASGAWITRDSTQAVCAMLSDAGHQAWFVGGCVRNALLNAPVDDIDICTDAHPDRVMALATAAGLKPVPTGIDHGTITVVSGGIGHEVTTLRRDIETFGRHAVVAYADTIEQDAARRDFTMNALYADAAGVISDPLGGLPDLAARHIRFIGDPAQRITEDYLRILRFFRFTAWYGDPALGMDAAGLAACADHLDGLEMLAAERIGAEMRKLLSAPDPVRAVAAMAQSGVLLRVLPGADVTALGPLVHLEGLAGLDPDPMLRLAALGGDGVADRLRLSRAQARAYDTLYQWGRQGADAAVMGYRLGAQMGTQAVVLHHALMGAPLNLDLIERIRQGAEAKFPIRPADLMPAFSGPALGARLRQLEQLWIESGFRATRKDLLSKSE